MKNIVVPIDFSEHAENALYMAANIAKREQADIHLIHTLGIGDHLLATADATRMADAAPFVKFAEMRFLKFIDKPYLEDIKVSYVIKKSDVTNEIADFANEVNADLIVMGSHGASGIEEYFIGSNTQKVVRYSDVPVMVVKKRMIGFTIEKAVFVSDFRKENIASYKKAIQLFNLLDVQLHLTYINTPDNFKSSPEINEIIASFFDAIEPEYQRPVSDVRIFNNYTVERGILEYSKAVNASLIGIPTHGRKGFSHIFQGSIGENLVNHSEFPVITFKI